MADECCAGSEYPPQILKMEAIKELIRLNKASLEPTLCVKFCLWVRFHQAANSGKPTASRFARSLRLGVFFILGPRCRTLLAPSVVVELITS